MHKPKETSKLYTPLIYTPTGFAKQSFVPAAEGVLDVGCGNRKVPGAIGIDLNPRSQADVVHDLNVHPWPLKNDTFEVVLVSHVLEHVHDIRGTLKEIHRVSKKGGRVVVQVPYVHHPDAFHPEHLSYFTSQSGILFEEYGLFRIIAFWFGWPHPSKRLSARLFKWFIHAYPRWYELHVAAVMPAQCLTWELEILK